MNTCLRIMKNEPESSPLNKTKRNRYQPPRFVSIYNMFPFHIHRIWSTPKTILGIDNFNQKSFHRLAPFFSVTKVDAINICWLCVVSILCVFYDMEKKILFVYCHLADNPGGKVYYGDALANNKTNNCCSPFAAKTTLSLSHHHSETNSLSQCF